MTPTRDDGPRWPVLIVSFVVAGLVFLPLVREGVGLYFYAFPLFPIGIVYVWQHRTRFDRVWWLTFVAITPLSAVALALDWAFSGHVLWNVLFLVHAHRVIRSRPWVVVLVASLIHLVTLKAVFQRAYDVYGAGVSVVVAAAILVVMSACGALGGVFRTRGANRSRPS